MSHQFKPSDLAMIIGAYTVPDNIGKQCELVEYLLVEGISEWVDPADGCRLGNAAEGLAWLVVGEGLRSYCGGTGWVLADARHLMPLRGDFAPEQHKEQAVPA